MNKNEAFCRVFFAIFGFTPIDFVSIGNTDGFGIIGGIHKNNIGICSFNEVFTVKATIKFNIAIAITMNQHVGCRKPIGLFFYFNTIDMLFPNLLHQRICFIFCFTATAVCKFFDHGLHEKRATSTCGVQNTLCAIDASNTAHKFGNMIRCECLVFIGFSSILVKGDKKHI